MAPHRRKLHDKSLLGLKMDVRHWQELIKEQAGKRSPQAINDWQSYQDAVEDYEQHITTDYANDKREIARSLGSELKKRYAETGIRVRSQHGPHEETKKVLAEARSFLPTGGPPYPRGVPAQIIKEVAKKLDRTEGSTKQILYRHKLFE